MWWMMVAAMAGTQGSWMLEMDSQVVCADAPDLVFELVRTGGGKARLQELPPFGTTELPWPASVHRLELSDPAAEPGAMISAQLEPLPPRGSVLHTVKRGQRIAMRTSLAPEQEAGVRRMELAIRLWEEGNNGPTYVGRQWAVDLQPADKPGCLRLEVSPIATTTGESASR